MQQVEYLRNLYPFTRFRGGVPKKCSGKKQKIHSNNFLEENKASLRPPRH